MTEITIKKEIVRVCQRLYQNGFVANHDGNVTHRIGSKLIATPTAQSKSDITESMLITTDSSGIKLTGKNNVFSEIKLHSAIFQVRSDIASIVHAHPPFATALSIARFEFPKPTMAEIIVSLGDKIPFVPFATPGSEDEKKNIQKFILDHDAVILSNHGVIAVGSDPMHAYYRLELVEHYSKINFLAKCLGGLHSIDQASIDGLMAKRPKKKEPNLRNLIVDEIHKALNSRKSE